jgi:hypothetical protein
LKGGVEIEQGSCDASGVGVLAERRFDGDCEREEHAETRRDARGKAHESCEDDKGKGVEA